MLSKAGVPTTVLEKAPFVGGWRERFVTKLSTASSDSTSVGIAGSPRTTSSTRSSGGCAEELLWVNRISRIYFDGKYVDYPLKISNALQAIGPVVAAKAMADYGRTRVKQRISPSPVESMEDAYIDQFGPTLYQLFFQRYSEKVGSPRDQMSGDWVSQRSKGMSLVTAVKDAVVPTKGKVVSLIDEFMYPRVGSGVSRRGWPTPLAQRETKYGSTRGRESPSRRESSRRHHGIHATAPSASKRTTTFPPFL